MGVLRRGFTLIEMLVVIAIILILFSLSMAVAMYVHKQAKITATSAMIQNLQSNFASYKMNYGDYPIMPGGSGYSADDSTAPGYFQTECAPCGQSANGHEDNSKLAKLLSDTGTFAVNQISQGGQIRDKFNRPLIFRFLVVAKGSGDDRQREPHPYIWSYGPDGINQTQATPVYTNKPGPDYDNAEAQAIDASSAVGNDDIRQ